MPTPYGKHMEDTLTRTKIAAALRALGLAPGAAVFVHSALSSMGHVAGGAAAVVDALIDVLGPAGTLVVPTFTFIHGRSDNPVFDPARDPSEMGRITEETRTRAGARRSCHLLHSVAALGVHAEEIAAFHGPAAWAADGPFWKLHDLDAHILLLGVPYLRCTYFHLLEQLVQVRYRSWRNVEARVREQDGSIRPLPTFVYSPGPSFVGNDFNKLGNLLEERGLVRVGNVGNAIARLFRARDAFDLGLAQYRQDPRLFLLTSDRCTPLRDGILTDELNNEKSVLDPALIYSRR